MSNPGLADYVRLARHGGLFRAWSFFKETQLYDLLHGTDTAHWMPKKSFSADLPNVEHGYHYEASYTSQIERCIRLVGTRVPLASYAFYDLGCGKGKALLVAAKAGLHSVTGLEYAADLVTIARANLAKTGAAATVIEGDAAEFGDYDRRSIVYLFNPFDADLLRRVLARIEASIDDCIVVYTNPVHSSVFAAWERLATIEGRHSSLTSHIFRRRVRSAAVPGEGG